MNHHTHPPLLAALWLALTATADDAQQQAPRVQAPWIGYATSYYPQGIEPTDSALVDLDGNGTLDLVTISNPVNPQLSVLFGDGRGAFSPAQLQSLAVGGESIEAADLDQDGDADLVIADTGLGTTSDTVSVILNQGGGSLAAPVQFPIGGPPRALAIADVDGDGNLDITAALLQSVGLVLGNGDGTFQPAQAFITAPGVRDLAAGDLDADGDVDLVVGHDSKQISVLDNIGIGFAPPVTYASIPSGFFNADANIHLADFDLDGDLDAHFSSTSTGSALGGPGFGAIAFFRNAGDGSFLPAETVLLDSSAEGAVDIEVIDVTGDGWPDLVAAIGSRIWALVRGDGAGGFQAPVSYHTGGGPTAAEAGDLNADGQSDVVILSRAAMGASVHLNQGAGEFLDPPFVEMVDASVAPASSSQLVSADIDLDGDLDVAVGFSENFNGSYGLSVRRNLGNGSFAPAEHYSTPQFPEWVALGDVDGDLLPELVWLDGFGAFNARLRMKKNLGSGSFGSTKTLPGSYCEQDARVLLLDVNADSLSDILVYTCYDRVFVLLNAGSGEFQAPLTTTVSAGSGALAGGDFDGDGFADIVTNSGIQGYVEVSLGLGTGQFLPPTTEVTGRGVEALAVGDLNRDGQPDIVAAYSLDGDGVSVLLGQGDGTFAQAVNYAGTYSGSTDNVSLGDLDGDGLLDILIANSGAQEISYWRGLGNGAFEPQRRFGAGRPPTSVVAGDYTGNGIPDLMILVEPQGFGNWYYPAVSLLEGLTSQKSGPRPAVGLPPLDPDLALER